jgi:hypothetical protein
MLVPWKTQGKPECWLALGRNSWRTCRPEAGGLHFTSDFFFFDKISNQSFKEELNIKESEIFNNKINRTKQFEYVFPKTRIS